MRKFLIISMLCLMAFSAQAANLTDAFQGTLSTFAGENGAGFAEQRSVEPIIANFITVALSFLGVVFLLLTLYAGFMWMMAMGDEKKAKTSRDLLTAAVIGLIIVVASYAITLLVMNRFTSTLIIQ
ncbi:hypothetical protein COT94_02010 [Candidatus Falkowbacteria bacterium CG10_big_fil_rev_8_21_14_0_10_37_14]|uniref:Uncharacterized protein n=1 Tax=Candidatus Falkowbacteria bacterium CG10_big_fil_rev_8_21_14_0_10_37_14 TaxID=1974561 RepID=A0A2M6WTA6_9BACT|nr:hypothetical protein [Candidatus Falkowbacteria bacterium]PIT96018.1 MAG: hypothetical protein COT94_02010 [Candidatus Falkowbacteria bacterium CG10_big_fil_rev_8_21_14_0_10_37_14]